MSNKEIVRLWLEGYHEVIFKHGISLKDFEEELENWGYDKHSMQYKAYRTEFVKESRLSVIQCTPLVRFFSQKYLKTVHHLYTKVMNMREI